MMKQHTNPASRLLGNVSVTYGGARSPSKQTPRPMRTMAAPVVRAHFWIVAPNQPSVVGECETAIVKTCTKATPAEEIARDI